MLSRINEFQQHLPRNKDFRDFGVSGFNACLAIQQLRACGCAWPTEYPPRADICNAEFTRLGFRISGLAV